MDNPLLKGLPNLPSAHCLLSSFGLPSTLWLNLLTVMEGINSCDSSWLAVGMSTVYCRVQKWFKGHILSTIMF